MAVFVAWVVEPITFPVGGVAVGDGVFVGDAVEEGDGRGVGDWVGL